MTATAPAWGDRVREGPRPCLESIPWAPEIRVALAGSRLTSRSASRRSTRRRSGPLSLASPLEARLFLRTRSLSSFTRCVEAETSRNFRRSLATHRANTQAGEISFANVVTFNMDEVGWTAAVFVVLLLLSFHPSSSPVRGHSARPPRELPLVHVEALVQAR